MRSIPAGQFKQQCLALLDEVAASGEPIVVTKRGRAVAAVTPLASDRDGDWRGALRDRGTITGDLLAPAVPSDEWDAVRR